MGTSSKAAGTWYGYSAYQPQNIQKMPEIFRAYYNYCLAGKDKMTPAMRLDLARAVIDPEDIMYFTQIGLSRPYPISFAPLIVKVLLEPFSRRH